MERLRSIFSWLVTAVVTATGASAVVALSRTPATPESVFTATTLAPPATTTTRPAQGSVAVPTTAAPAGHRSRPRRVAVLADDERADRDDHDHDAARDDDHGAAHDDVHAHHPRRGPGPAVGHDDHDAPPRRRWRQ